MALWLYLQSVSKGSLSCHCHLWNVLVMYVCAGETVGGSRWWHLWQPLKCYSYIWAHGGELWRRGREGREGRGEKGKKQKGRRYRYLSTYVCTCYGHFGWIHIHRHVLVLSCCRNGLSHCCSTLLLIMWGTHTRARVHKHKRTQSLCLIALWLVSNGELLENR